MGCKLPASQSNTDVTPAKRTKAMAPRQPGICKNGAQNVTVDDHLRKRGKHRLYNNNGLLCYKVCGKMVDHLREDNIQHHLTTDPRHGNSARHVCCGAPHVLAPGFEGNNLSSFALVRHWPHVSLPKGALQCPRPTAAPAAP